MPQKEIHAKLSSVGPRERYVGQQEGCAGQELHTYCIYKPMIRSEKPDR